MESPESGKFHDEKMPFIYKYSLENASVLHILVLFQR